MCDETKNIQIFTVLTGIFCQLRELYCQLVNYLTALMKTVAKVQYTLLAIDRYSAFPIILTDTDSNTD